MNSFSPFSLLSHDTFKYYWVSFYILLVIFRHYLNTNQHHPIRAELDTGFFPSSSSSCLLCPYKGVQISAAVSSFSSTLHRFFNTIIWMLQELILLYSLFQRMLCHLLIAKRTIEHIWKRRAILNYFMAFFAIFIFLY